MLKLKLIMGPTKLSVVDHNEFHPDLSANLNAKTNRCFELVPLFIGTGSVRKLTFCSRSNTFSSIKPTKGPLSLTYPRLMSKSAGDRNRRKRNNRTTGSDIKSLKGLIGNAKCVIYVPFYEKLLGHVYTGPQLAEFI